MKGQLEQLERLNHAARRSGQRERRRLRPLIAVPWKYGHVLQQLGVPVDGIEREKAEQGIGMRAFRVPKCCAEIILAKELSQLSFETVARLAADVYFEEAKATQK